MKTIIANVIILCAAVAWGAPTYVVEGDGGYNCWPMIGAVGNRLVCTYTMGKAHAPSEKGRGAFARYSDDGGVTWSARHTIAVDPKAGISSVAKGVDFDGAGLFWFRRLGVEPRMALYRTRDGEHFEQIAAPTLSPNAMQITDIIKVQNVLMCLWFSDDYAPDRANKSWGTLLSADNGRTWTQRVVEQNLAYNDWPTEPSVVLLSNGFMLAIARSEGGSGNLFELTSKDWGNTWTKRRTNIGDVNSSTPSLVYDRATGIVKVYYFHRGPGSLKVRQANAGEVFDDPLKWSEPKTIAWGNRQLPYDSGNANAVRLNGRDYVAFYAGNQKNCRVLVTQADVEDDWRSWAGKRVVFFGDSITDPVHVGCTKNYWGFLAERMNFRDEVYGRNGAQWNGLVPQVETAKKNIPSESVDAVFIFFGTNDFNGNTPPGEWYNVKDETVNYNGRQTPLKKRELNFDRGTSRGNVNAGLKLVRETYPNAQVVLLTPVHRGFAEFGAGNVQPPEEYSRQRGLFIDDYVEDVRTAGRIWSCPVIDLFAESSFLPNEPWADKLINNPKRDRLHPSTAGHERLARLIEMKIRSLPASYR